MIQNFSTNLNCGSCIAAVTPFLNKEPTISRWSVDTADPRKVLTIEGESVAPSTVERIVADAGFRVLGRIDDPVVRGREESAQPAPFLITYRPLLLILAYLVGLVALIEFNAVEFSWMRTMRHFMGGFFVAFSFFKLLNLQGFADAFQTYDVLARKSRAYAVTYPFIELSLGIAYLANFRPTVTNGVTLVVMLIGVVGVTKALLQKQRIQCACLGTIFNLRMSKVTFIEDALMAAMAAMLVLGR
jgi:hypothetical protein